MLGKLWQRVKQLFSPRVQEEELRQHMEQLIQKAPVPVFWLLGRTQSGKTTVIRYLTGAERAEIGRGFQPCTRFSDRYRFPTELAPLLTFLDTRGLDEPGYDPAADITLFNDEAHVVLVTVKLLDHAQEQVVEHLRKIRAAMRRRPIVLVVTCLHEAYPQQQHPLPYPFGKDAEPLPGAEVSPQVLESLAFQKQRFAGLFDRVVAVDRTPGEEGVNERTYEGGQVGHRLLVE